MLLSNPNTIKSLIDISNELDARGLHSLANKLDSIMKKASPLSDEEVDQLGSKHPSSRFDYIDKDKWNKLRDILVSKKPSRSYVETDEFKYDPELTAYTPGEAEALLSHPKIKEWFDKIEEFRIPEEYKHIVLVPCAASKPWGANCPSSGKYYKAYHEIKKDLQEADKLTYWVTISEPLGIVPEDMWDSFPGYDVPGLFKDPSSRMSGMTTKQWNNTFGQKYSPPFDNEAYSRTITKLGEVIHKFISNNTIPGRRWISFIGGTKGKVTTHTEMMNEALKFLESSSIDFPYTAYTKDKDQPGHPTKSRIMEHVGGALKEELDKDA